MTSTHKLKEDTKTQLIHFDTQRGLSQSEDNKCIYYISAT